jgi:hypothetical protein
MDEVKTSQQESHAATSDMVMNAKCKGRSKSTTGGYVY